MQTGPVWIAGIANGSSEVRPLEPRHEGAADPARATAIRRDDSVEVTVFCGIDWAEDHHDIAVVDAAGQLVTKRRIGDTAEGFRELMTVLADIGDTAEDPLPVAIESSRGLLVSALRETGRSINAINPMAVARYRERHSVARKKSDHADAVTLANILRTDAHVHRTIPADSELARSIAVLARAAQDAIWRRSKVTQELRAVLREYYPVLLETFAGNTATNLAKREARAVLAIAPTPEQGAKLSKPCIIAALRRAGRQRNLEATAGRIKDCLRQPQLRQPAQVEHAMGQQALRLLATLNTECASVEELDQAATEAFRQHPDHAIITSFPGIGETTGARVFAEIGDHRDRFADARALKAFAGAAPVTRASGRSITISHRRVKNDRLAAVGFVWAFAAIPRPGPIKDHYNGRRARGDRHAAALRHTFNRLLGCLYHFLQTRHLYDEARAFPNRTETPTLAAA